MEKLKKLKIEPGKSYRGSAYLNDYGQWVFTPESKGAHADRLKMIFHSPNEYYSIKETKNRLIINVSIPKKQGDISTNLSRLTNSFCKALKKLSQYDDN